MSQSRRQRRQMAKQFGLLGKKESFSDMRERIRRAQQMGKQIHLKNLENNRNNQIEADLDKERKSQDSLIKEVVNREDREESDIQLNPGSFDFLNDVKDGPQAASENVSEDNA
jgi:hypothetical protein